MRAIWRVALAFFTFVPLLSWISLVGALFVVIGLLAQLLTLGGADEFTVVFMLIGAALIGMAPAFSGGALLRFGSSLLSLRLRPHGRERVLLGATLVITILAALAALPFLFGDPGARAGRGAPLGAWQVFQVIWGGVALSWILMFVLSGWRFGMAFFWIVPVVGMNLPRYLPRVALPEPFTLLVVALAAWALFALWFLRVDRIRPAAGWSTNEQAQDGALTGAAAYVRGAAPATAAQALRQLLNGSAPPITFLAIGAGQALLVLGVFWFVSRAPGGVPRTTILLSGFFYIGILVSGWSTGYGLVRRARMLWLRAGLDRAGLYRRAEREGRIPFVLMSAGALLVIIAAQLLVRPELAPTILACAAVHCALAACLYYQGLASTTGLTVQDFFEAVGWVVLGGLAIVFAAPARLGEFTAEPSMPLLMAAFALLVLLTLPLRWRARRRWLALDWRVAKLLTMPRALQRSRA